jgi:hypothetical protein
MAPGTQKCDLPDYSVSGESPLGSCHRGGTFKWNVTTERPGRPEVRGARSQTQGGGGLFLSDTDG